MNESTKVVLGRKIDNMFNEGKIVLIERECYNKNHNKKTENEFNPSEVVLNNRIQFIKNCVFSDRIVSIDSDNISIRCSISKKDDNDTDTYFNFYFETQV